MTRPLWTKMISRAKVGWWAIIVQADIDPIEYRRWALTHSGARRKLRRMFPDDLNARRSGEHVGA